MIPNEEKEGWHYLAVKNYLHYYMEQYYIEKHKSDFYCLITFIFLEQKANLNLMKKYVKAKSTVEL